MRRQGIPGSGPGEPFDAVAILPENAAYAIVQNPGEPCEKMLLNGGTHRFGQKGVGYPFRRINKHGFDFIPQACQSIKKRAVIGKAGKQYGAPDERDGDYLGVENCRLRHLSSF